MKKFIIIFLSWSSIVCTQVPDDAINFYNDADGIGARAQAMGNAFIGIADDYSATYWNPAGLAKMQKSELTGDFNYLRFNNSASYMGTTSVDNLKESPAFSPSFPFRHATDLSSP